MESKDAINENGRYRIITLEELGPRLPIGIYQDSNPIKDITDLPFKMKQERLLGGIRDKERQINVAKFVSIVLSNLCTKIGPYDFSSMEEPERRLSVSQMYMPDVYYTYVWLRTRAIGSELVMDLNCPNCKHKFEYIGDLNSVEVRIPIEDNVDALMWDYKLRDPFKIRDKMVEGFKLGLVKWGAIEPVSTGAFNTGEAKAALIRGSIQEIMDWDSVALIADELDGMSKFDLEEISQSIEENRFGPELAIETKCPKCDQVIATMLDWGYDSFFSTSSRSRRPK